jgi:hypothetical protein
MQEVDFWTALPLRICHGKLVLETLEFFQPQVKTSLQFSEPKARLVYHHCEWMVLSCICCIVLTCCHRTRYHYGTRPQAEQNWNYSLEKDTRPQEWVDNKPSFSHQLKHFIATARGEASPNCSVDDGLRAVFVIEAVHDSLRNGKAAPVRKI